MTKIFLDGGTHLGGGLKAITRKEGIDKSWKVYSWEANPYTYRKNLENKQKYQRYVIEFFNSALSTYNGKLKVMILQQREKHTGEIVNTGQGTTILPLDTFSNTEVKLNQLIETVEMPCINFVEWIEKNTSDQDEIYIKLDIEGAEYDVLEHLISHKVIHRIKKIYVEWHSYALKNKKSYDARQTKIEQSLQNTGIEVISWI